ncbi:MAG: DUF2079 domain-containing protein [Actinomycetota bacterium]|nr:DUF2079 domain-containing protein [Actinomycetota bacterium]
MHLSSTAGRASARRSWWHSRAALGSEPGLLALVGVSALIDSAASILRYVHLQSGVDLALFDQAVWHYSRFEAPFSSIRNQNLLGDHFHPLVAVLAPLYWVWSDARMLLIAQSVLLATSVVPVFLFARPRVGRAGAYLLAGAYAAFWGLQVGVLFDFHEVAFAPLLIALAILLADTRRWGWFWLVIALLLGVKEDLSIFVVFFGVYLLSRREIWRGVALVVIGIAWYELTTRVLIPHFAAGTPYTYWTYGELGQNLPDAIWALVRAPWRLFTIGFSPAQKAQTIVGLMAPFLLLSLWSRLFILAIPLLAERFLSTNPGLWTPHLHYSLPIAPVLAMGASGGLAHLARLLPERRRRGLAIAATGAMLVASLAITSFGTGESALSQLTQRSFYHAPSYAGGAFRALRHVPASASLETVDSMLAYTSQRGRQQQIRFGTVRTDQYLLANVLQPTCCGASGDGAYDVLGKLLDSELERMTPIFYDHGWLVARGPPSGQPASTGVLVPMPTSTALDVDTAWLRWHAVFTATGARLSGCFKRWQQHEPSATACFDRANAPFQRAQSTLSRSIRVALPGLHEACTQLATAALLSTHQLRLDLVRLASAGASPDRASLVPASTAAAADERNQDLSGQLDRFVILCTAR